uniref:Uncharacterized protein n=1 Tax=Octopus bimaculoides TaxID=37653 RepID=A0A0L8FKD4_OCTBM
MLKGTTLDKKLHQMYIPNPYLQTCNKIHFTEIYGLFVTFIDITTLSFAFGLLACGLSVRELILKEYITLK